ncbi:hypothetical protein E1B28_007940 [Marasmius oreades]|uniref:Uncharacterized protein n=1 Tax=Marasmius oreades TaxID=181124 RepID=A0A9P7UUI7_9AGAR|nr:uncharacterized protein E1B28_007940 [Marasmius oreades]KAG7094340.1 hypothetical protein E1B28_007940 [Marasmius oreades]
MQRPYRDGCALQPRKKKIGNYYSTPIFSFRCKCHLCSGWFQSTWIQTTRVMSFSQERGRKMRSGIQRGMGFAIHDTDEKAENADPLAALEKSTYTQNHNKNDISKLNWRYPPRIHLS